MRVRAKLSPRSQASDQAFSSSWNEAKYKGPYDAGSLGNFIPQHSNLFVLKYLQYLVLGTSSFLSLINFSSCA